MSIRFINDHRDWRISLDKLLELKNASVLDEHQRYLCGILRYGGDWRIKERALEYAADIQKPTDDLLEDICAVMTNRNTSINLRILAADALRVLVPRKMRRTMAYPVFRGTSVLRVMKDMLKAPEVPALREAITNALKAMKQE
ncbi:MAG: hypothetical protein A4E65_00984 [Syntrophorhabdus sp. PtaU1.Bin153]|nr:MAG: hypothetical protein A4E65_00984 [Syntrophorhabdus sp. PtaU1.Bin153]